MKKLKWAFWILSITAVFSPPFAAYAQAPSQIPLALKSSTVMIYQGADSEILRNQLQQAMGTEKPSESTANRIMYQYKEGSSKENIMIYFGFDASGRLEEVGICSLNISANKPAQKLKNWLQSNIGNKKPEDKKVYKKSWGGFVAVWEPKESKHEEKKRLENEFWEAAGFRISEECYGEGANTCLEMKKK